VLQTLDGLRRLQLPFPDGLEQDLDLFWIHSSKSTNLPPRGQRTA
jgi:hypothetical protein